MKVSKTEVSKQIAKLNKKIKGFDFKNPSNIKANAEYKNMIVNFSDYSKEELEKCLVQYGDIAAIYSARNQLNNLQTTMNSDLMKCDHKYVVTNTKSLVSPAGFHPESLVFMQTEIAIHTDTLDNIPASNVDLYGHKLAAI